MREALKEYKALGVCYARYYTESALITQAINNAATIYIKHMTTIRDLDRELRCLSWHLERTCLVRGACKMDSSSIEYQEVALQPGKPRVHPGRHEGGVATRAKVYHDMNDPKLLTNNCKSYGHHGQAGQVSNKRTVSLSRAV